MSDWEETDTYSPAAIDMAPATSPATPATRMLRVSAPAAATPNTRLAVETMPSLASLPEDFREAFFGGLDYAVIGRRLV